MNASHRLIILTFQLNYIDTTVEICSRYVHTRVGIEYLELRGSSTSNFEVFRGRGLFISQIRGWCEDEGSILLDFRGFPWNSSAFPQKKYKILQISRIFEAEGCIFLKFEDETRTRTVGKIKEFWGLPSKKKTFSRARTRADLIICSRTRRGRG